MASLDMYGPYELTIKKIDEVVTKTSPGNYALGNASDSRFHVRCVGRSDENINNRLKSWVGVNNKYEHFKFSYATSSNAAFEKECKNYHDFGEDEKLDNKEHPKRPDNTKWKCPICDIYD